VTIYKNKNVVKQSVIMMTDNFESYKGKECDGSDPFSENESASDTELFMYTFKKQTTTNPSCITNEKL
jgi:hypothetical protein